MTAAHDRPVSVEPSDIATKIEALTTSDLHQLRVQWRKVFRREAPHHLTRSLLVRILAYRMQETAYGGLDRDSLRYLEKIAEGLRTGKESNSVPAVPDERRGRLRPGTLLEREHDSVMQRVMVVQDGFTWMNTTYTSLSEVARAITGTNWNGPRFFGLRGKDDISGSHLKASRMSRGTSSAEGSAP